MTLSHRQIEITQCADDYAERYQALTETAPNKATRFLLKLLAETRWEIMEGRKARLVEDHRILERLRALEKKAETQEE